MKTSAWLIGALLLAGSFFCSSAPAQKQSAHSTKIKSYYREKIAPDIQPKALWDGRKLMPFHAANFPKMLPASAAGFLDENEYVLGLTVNGESRAYPTRYAAFHHIINDSVGRPDQGGKQFVAVTYCVVCNSGVRFDPVVNGRLLKFDFYGIYNGVVTMYDRNTKSVWLQIGGRAIKGPMCGTELKTGPLLDTTWGRWKTLHPDTLVMAPEARYSEYYEPEGEPVPRGFTSFPGSYFPKSITHRDTRLPTFAMVLTVTVPQPPADVLTASDTTATRTPALYRAYPLKTLKASSGSVNDMLGTTPIAVFFEP
ncbi:MAG TPA: DUF3179 domain-containing (seleno)protein, partial [Chthonomonadaceae bacterium]|nr:DUF3179 domain-containing (seleno)protein [Chthonomonadaceae bacterium]